MKTGDLRIVLFGLLSLPLASAVDAAKGDLESCAVIKSDAARLVCYDKISGRSKPNKKSFKEGRWRVSLEKDPLDDSQTTHLFLVSDSGSNYKNDKPVLNVRCMGKKQELYINWDTFVASDYASIKMRIDDKEPFQEDMNMSTNNEATFTQYADKYIKELRVGKKFVAQVVPFGANPITAIFSLNGLDKALRRVENECGW